MGKQRTQDDEDDFDPRVLKDGETYRVPFRMMDATSRAVAEHFKHLHVADASGEAGLALNRPGFRYLAGGNAGDAILRDGEARDRAEAYRDWERDATNAWRDAAKTGDIVTDIKKSASDAADVYAAYEEDLENAWRRG